MKLNNYLSAPKEDLQQTDILMYWEKYDSFPELARFALDIHIIPGSSVASEKDFSAAEYTISKRRSCLHPSLVEKLMFLNRNFKFLSTDVNII